MKKTKLFLLLIIVLVVGVILSYLFYNNSSKDKISSEEAIDRVVDNIIIHEPPVRIEQGEVPVSYTHLDVYKRQALGWILTVLTAL